MLIIPFTKQWNKLDINNKNLKWNFYANIKLVLLVVLVLFIIYKLYSIKYCKKDENN